MLVLECFVAVVALQTYLGNAPCAVCRHPFYGSNWRWLFDRRCSHCGVAFGWVPEEAPSVTAAQKPVERRRVLAAESGAPLRPSRPQRIPWYRL